MNASPIEILTVAGRPGPLAVALAAALDGAFAGEDRLRILVNADQEPAAAPIVARCRAFMDGLPHAVEGLIVTIFAASPKGLAHLHAQQAAAGLWAFTQAAALDWAPRRIRVNAIGLGVSPVGPFAATRAAPASLADIARTVCAIACFPSMTGQIIRLGPNGEPG